eukprot:FR740420.1.p1 GENE.FR740420.1~~FR740420.1.p1  ORF type:complete len:305 (+),score=22.37 FR740420.1:86-916(+)
MIASAEFEAEAIEANNAATTNASTATSSKSDSKSSRLDLQNTLRSFNFFGRRGSNSRNTKPLAPPKPLLLVAKCEISLGIFGGTCSRRLAVTCPDVEACPPQCIVVGAGEPSMNGTYDMQGYRHDSPWYVNENGVNLSREITDGIHGWKFGQLGTFFYLEEAQQHQQQQESRQDLGHDRQARGSFGVQDGKGGEPGKSSGDIGVGGGDSGDSGSGSGGSDECGESGGGGRGGDPGTGSLAKDDLVSTNLDLNSGSTPSSNQRDANFESQPLRKNKK